MNEESSDKTAPADAGETRPELQTEPFKFFALPKELKEAGRVFCVLFLLLLFCKLVPFLAAGLPGLLMGLLLYGALPALWLLYLGKAGSRPKKQLRAVAILALYGVFVPFWLFVEKALPSDALEGGLTLLLYAPVAHALWLLLASPYLIRRLMARSDHEEKQSLKH